MKRYDTTIISKQSIKYLAKLLISLFGLLCTVYLVNRFYGEKGGVENSVSLFFLEFPLLIISYLSILSILKNKFSVYLLAGLPFVLFYVFFNEFYLYFNRLLRFSDIYQIPELVKFSDYWLVVICFLLVILYGYLLIKGIDKKKMRRPYYLVFFFLILIYSIKIYPKSYINLNQFFGFYENTQKQKGNAQIRGSLNYLFYIEAKRNLAYEKIGYDKETVLKEKLKLKKDFRNIHLIVLESFYDPNMFSKLSFSENPIFLEFDKKFSRTNNYSISPVYAGGTPQAEFELLTGIPAYQEYSAVEFNLLTGKKVDGFINNLNKVGYYTMAMNADSPEIFNSYNAYKSIGFQDQYYLHGKEYSKTKKRYELIFDGDLFKRNLEVLDSLMKLEPNVSIFNYVLGLYGHAPFYMDESKHPNIIEIKLNGEKVDKYESRTINQIYYRTKALNEYIDSLNKMDPNSLIIVIGDHMPHMNDLEYGYANKYKIRFYIWNKGKPIDIGKTIHHYNLPSLIINLLSGEEIRFNEQELRARYKKLFYESLN